MINSKIRGDISTIREMKKDYCIEKEDEGGGGLLANPDLALQVYQFRQSDFKLNFLLVFLMAAGFLGEELTDEPSASLPWHRCCWRSNAVAMMMEFHPFLCQEFFDQFLKVSNLEI